MISVPLETSEQIEQRFSKEDGPPKIRGFVWLLVARQYLACFFAAEGLLLAFANEVGPGFLLFSFSVLSLSCGLLWLMVKRRRAVVWVFCIQTGIEFGIASLIATTDSAQIAIAIACTGLVAYVLMSRRVRETFFRTLGEPTK